MSSKQAGGSGRGAAKPRVGKAKAASQAGGAKRTAVARANGKTKPPKKTPTSGKSVVASRPKPGRISLARTKRFEAEAEQMLRRSPEITTYDTYGRAIEAEEDYFVVPEPGKVYGRCGGRAVQSQMEKRICDKLCLLGVAHSHRPRRYEVKTDNGKIAAYSPCIVLRGRGREGKTAIIEVLADTDASHASKVRAFRKLYDAEFYVIFVAPGRVFDAMATDVYDESILPSEIGSLVARLAE